jgi:hypothetical protein
LAELIARVTDNPGRFRYPLHKMQAAAVEFELSVKEAGGPSGYVELEAVLTSAALDAGMHPDGKVDVFITTVRREDGPGEGYVLDGFQVRSLREYLKKQAAIRKVLERKLAADQEEIDPEGDPIRGEVWSWAEVESLRLRRREGRKDQKTTTFFTLSVRCDWCDELATITDDVGVGAQRARGSRGILP